MPTEGFTVGGHQQCPAGQCEQQQGCRQTSRMRCVRAPGKAVIKECRETAVTSKMTLRVGFVEQAVEQPGNLVSVSP